MKHNAQSFYTLSCQDKEFDDYLLLGGGTDISTRIYNEEAMPQTQYPNLARDTRNIEAINRAVAAGKPIFGICRGQQLLDAVFGGKLIQHTVGHPNGVKVHTEDGVIFDDCHNCHHQVVDSKYTKGSVLGWSTHPFEAYFGDKVEIRYVVPQIMYWPDKKALAVQFHPEWHNTDHPMNEHIRGLLKDLLGLENVL